MQNFRTDVSSFDKIPSGELYIFPGTPAPADPAAQDTTGPAGEIPQALSYSCKPIFPIVRLSLLSVLTIKIIDHFSQQAAYQVPGGSVKIIDSTSFPIAANFAAALVTVNPGAMR